MILLGGGGASSLTWDSTTHGVTQEGLTAILTSIKTTIDDATTYLQTGSDANTTLEAAIRQGWSGKDCDQWLMNLDALRVEVSGNLTFFYTQIETEFNKIFTEWETFQSTNVTEG